MTLIIAMFILGVLLVIAEVMFPSLGLLGLLAGGSFLVAILEAFTFGEQVGYAAVAGTIVSIPLAIFGGFYILKNTPLGNRLLLKAPDLEAVSGQGADKSLSKFEGQFGVTITPLAPSGTIEINDRSMSAVSQGEYIERDCRVQILKVEGNRVVVTDNIDANS